MEYYSEVTAPTFLKKSWNFCLFSVIAKNSVFSTNQQSLGKELKVQNEVTRITNGEKDQPRRKEMSSAHKKIESFREINILVT